MCIVLLPFSPATTTLAIMQSQTHFLEPNRYILDFLHPNFTLRYDIPSIVGDAWRCLSSLLKVWPWWRGSHLWISSKVFIFFEVECITGRRAHMRLELKARQLMVMPWLRGLANMPQIFWQMRLSTKSQGKLTSRLKNKT